MTKEQIEKLGITFTEGMTDDDVVKALSKKHAEYETEKAKQKGIIDKYSSEIADYKKEKADKMSVQQVCQDTFWDALRYSFFSKYGYKNNFCGKDRFTWDMIFMFLAVAICVGIIVIAWAITNLI